MKTTLIALAMLFSVTLAYAKPGQDQGPTNIDWLLMKSDERVALVTKLVSVLQTKGIPLSAPIEKYVNAITAVTEDPKIKKETPVSNILMSIAYTKEPGVRRVLDEAKAKIKAQREAGVTAPAAK
jgi:hypothetical protein